MLVVLSNLAPFFPSPVMDLSLCSLLSGINRQEIFWQSWWQSYKFYLFFFFLSNYSFSSFSSPTDSDKTFNAEGTLLHITAKNKTLNSFHYIFLLMVHFKIFVIICYNDWNIFGVLQVLNHYVLGCCTFLDNLFLTVGCTWNEFLTLSNKSILLPCHQLAAFDL